MNEPVSAVLVDRAADPGGLSRMVAFSLGAHVIIVGLLALMPTTWLPEAEDAERVVMTISLGGAPGPRAGGMTPMGGRPVQEVRETESRRPEPVRPPAAATPEMSEPAPAHREPQRRTPVRSAPQEARGRTPSRGEEVRSGSAIAETGGRGMGFGLTSGGGGTGGYLDVGNFCCPEYLSTMLDLIQRHWSSKQGVSGQSVVKFTIQRDGRLTDVTLEKTSGYAALDLTAQRAVVLTRQLPPLPAAFSENQLTVHLVFQYQP